jgi:hypothetical protein
MLKSIIERHGGDPTAVTPSMDLQATASRGVMQVIVDPRTTLLQSLEAIPHHGSSCEGPPGATGSVMVKVVPCPSTLSTVTCPSCAATTSWTT